MLVKALALESDARYFELAAEKTRLSGADLAWMPALKYMYSASTAQRVDPAANPDVLLPELEAAVTRLGLPSSRLYVNVASPRWVDRLLQHGYEKRIEGVLAADAVVRKAWPRVSSLSLTPLIGDRDWVSRRELFGLKGHAPDGHSVDADDYIKMEQLKAAAGGIKFYLARETSGNVVASYAVMREQQVLRLKNLIVHPELRGRGMGSQVIYRVGMEADEQDVLVAYAVQQPNHPSLYERCGFHLLCEVFEWVKR